MIKISFILPVYNVEKFLPDCFKSLLCQGIEETEMEIICVDDGSTDKSADVIKEWSKEHKCIKLITQKNSGVCVARNNGFKNAKGEYVWFIDPDDMIAPYFFCEIDDYLINENIDVFEIGYRACPESESFCEDNWEEFSISEDNSYGSSGSVWTYICKRDYLIKNNIFLNEDLNYGEDYLWAFQVKYRKKICHRTYAPIYVYRQRSGSAMRTVSREKQEKHYLDMQTLFSLYKNEYDRCKLENLGQDVLSNILKRQQLCAESATYLLMKLNLPKKEFNENLKKLKEKNIYPYKFMTWNFGGKGTVNPLKFRLFAFLLPFEPYFRLMCFLHKKFVG